MSNAYFPGGAVERSATNEQNQELAKGCGQNRPIEAKSEIPAAPAPSLREKLKAIRDSDHPARYWARNVVEMFDAKREGHFVSMAQLAWNVVMMERRMHSDDAPATTQLTPEEIAAIFGLGTHQ